MSTGSDDLVAPAFKLRDRTVQVMVDHTFTVQLKLPQQHRVARSSGRQLVPEQVRRFRSGQHQVATLIAMRQTDDGSIEVITLDAIAGLDSAKRIRIPPHL